MDLSKFVPYRRGMRPPLPESFPQFVDTELQKLTAFATQAVEVIQALEARIAALEP